LDTVRAPYALELVSRSLAAGFRPTRGLLRILAEGLIMIDNESLLERLADLVDQHLGPGALDVLVEADRPTSEPLLRRLLQRGQDTNRATPRRMQDLLLALRQGAQCGLVAVQREALDGLEVLSRLHPDLP